MRLSDEELSLVVAKSSTLEERLLGQIVEPSGENRSLAQRRLARWKQLCGGSEPEKFASILRSAGVGDCSEEELLARLGSVKRIASAPWPDWSLLLNDLVESYSNAFNECRDPETETTSVAGRNTLPFSRLYHHVAAFAWDRARPRSIRLGSKPTRDLEDFLLKRLSSVGSLPLHSLFLAQRALGSSQTDWPYAERSEEVRATTDSSRQYKEFILKMGADGLRDLVLLYPVAARLIAEVTFLWIECVGELLNRVDQDRAELSRRFNNELPLGELTSIKLGLSDPHHRGRTVAILGFGGKMHLVYKPRSLRTDDVFFELVQGLNNAGLKPELQPLKVLDRGEYGWMEFVHHEPCKTKRAAHRFYQRAGSLVGLVDWLHGTDFHRENFIAAGDQPILIDLEALAHPISSTSLREPIGAYLPWSILRSGLLPYWQVRPSGSKLLYDNSALGAPVHQRALIGSVRWLNVNTDRMTWVIADRVYRHLTHRPRLKGKVLYIQDFAADVLRGHRSMAAVLESSRKFLFGRLRAQTYLSVRRSIKRPTVVYAMILRRSLRPENLGEGIDRSLAIQGLPVDVTNEQERAQEIADLERLDVPYFWSDTAASTTEPDKVLNRAKSHDHQREMIIAALDRRLIVREGLIETVSKPSKARRSNG